jgi:cytochrome oxidase Cu insertion factor (SCO1/SenC/PrrC family)
MTRHYEINEKDIDEVIRYLKTVDPENATPEVAIAFLEQLQASVHLMSHENPELLDKIYQDLKNKKSS